MPTAPAIRQAADNLGPGDIILLEIHRAGPGTAPACRTGYIAIEWWPDDFAAIRSRRTRGDRRRGGRQRRPEPRRPDLQYKPAGFPADWTNPFNRSNRDSGLIVGAGAPPPGTHGRDHGAQLVTPRLLELRLSRRRPGAWGHEVTTTGYGDPQGGLYLNEWYHGPTQRTSSASPIVVGAIAAYRGRCGRGDGSRCPGSGPRPSAGDRLAQTGRPGRPATQRIGNRPDLRQLIPLAHPEGLLGGRPIHRHATAKPDPGWVCSTASPLARELVGHAHEPTTWAAVPGLTWRRARE